ncbi:hypothetical protein VIGAN_08199000, partial [Vigna angularis var. angularis]
PRPERFFIYIIGHHHDLVNESHLSHIVSLFPLTLQDSAKPQSPKKKIKQFPIFTNFYPLTEKCSINSQHLIECYQETMKQRTTQVADQSETSPLPQHRHRVTALKKLCTIHLRSHPILWQLLSWLSLPNSSTSEQEQHKPLCTLSQQEESYGNRACRTVTVEEKERTLFS